MAARPVRLLVGGAWTTVLAAVVAHGAWRPLAVAWGGGGNAWWITAGAVASGLATAAIHRRAPARARLRWAGAMGVGLLFGGLAVASGSAPGPALGALALAGAAAAAILPRALAGIPGGVLASRAARTVTALAALAAVVQTARLATFVGDPARTAAAPSVIIPWLEDHSCATAYLHASRLAVDGVDNLYDARWWPALSDAPSARAQAELYAPFDLDTYAYPPQFLLAPAAFLAVGGGFSAQRPLWFAANALAVGLALWLVATWIGRRDARAGAAAHVWALVIWANFTTQVTLQVGNVHLAVMAAAVVAMWLHGRRRHLVGGALLAFAILAKISPGLLGVSLLAGRRWRAAAWTAAGGLAWTLVALAVFGWAPFEAFVEYQLPRLSSGEALAFFTADATQIASNNAPFGVPFKLAELGLPIADPWSVAAGVNLVYTIVVVVLAVVAGRAGGDRVTRAGLWLAVLTLATLRSPFAPAYTLFTALWLLTLWVARSRRPAAHAAVFIAAVALAGQPPMPASAQLVLSLVQQTVALLLVVVFIVRAARAPAAR